eukprot:751960-Hanusia_phi.AAC.6
MGGKGAMVSGDEDEECEDGIGAVKELAEIPVEDLLKRADAIKVRKELNSMGEQKISRLDFCRICNKYGFREQESLLLLESFHQSGIVLNFSNTSNTALKETVFIKPQDVLDTIWATFDLNGATRTQEIQRREQELEALSKELGALSTAKALIDEAAEREANRNIWIGGFVPLTAFGLLFRMTYWEYSWDIVEPISFFVSTMGPICFFYVWYAAKKEEFSLAGWRDQMMERSRTNLYRLKSFDLERYNYIVRAIEEVRAGGCCCACRPRLMPSCPCSCLRISLPASSSSSVSFSFFSTHPPCSLLPPPSPQLCSL